MDSLISAPNTCANCGKGEEESGKLQKCAACKLVKYCSRECQAAHRSMHKKECRKRAAELHDEQLFKQPPTLEEDCPICFVRMPTLKTARSYYSCCGKLICDGCVYAFSKRNELTLLYPFCRASNSTNDADELNRDKKRVEAGDAYAIHSQGCKYSNGTDGYPQDYTKALEMWHKSGKLGYISSYCSIGYFYQLGRGGVEVDTKKAIHYYERAALGGHVNGRFNLGIAEIKAGNISRTVKHFIIAVRDGDSESLMKIQRFYAKGEATKEDYAKALRARQAYLDEIRSDQRDEAFAYDSEKYRYY